MMKIIKYKFATEVNYGTDNHLNTKQVLSDASIPYSEENLKFANSEAYNGEVSVVDVDSELFPKQYPTTDDRIAALESAVLTIMGVSSNV